MNSTRYNQIIDEVYEQYWNSVETSEYDGFGSTLIKLPTLSQEQFINKCKTDLDFSKKWGLKIEERVLSLGERNQIGNFDYTMCDDSLIYPTMEDDRKKYKELFDKENIPTKVITLIYQNEKIEIYE